MKVRIVETTGDFAEDKDAAASIRDQYVRQAVKNKAEVTLDFSGVTLVTQSFVHALISDVLRNSGEDALRYIIFKGCNDGVQGIVQTVVQYSLDAMANGS